MKLDARIYALYRVNNVSDDLLYGDYRQKKNGRITKVVRMFSDTEL